jgi:2-dehydro-3-deoxyphosphogluconate aldolase/(4S)-4-hydroxy-2-oxoglutarate aldolase
MKDLDKALDAGAQFIVAPVVRKQVIKACVKKGIPVFPGALSPTEIYQAWKWGATMVKVFPAGKMGPSYMKDVLEPLNEIGLIPTGGINPDNFIEFLKMGASGVGMASALFPKDVIASGNWDALRGFYESIAQQYLRFKNEN